METTFKGGQDSYRVVEPIMMMTITVFIIIQGDYKLCERSRNFIGKKVMATKNKRASL
jgi:hypothetical protein